jgi:hypothetical protein
VGATVNGTPTTFDLDLRGLPSVLMESGRKYLPGMPGAGYDESGTWWNALTNAQGSIHQFVSQAGAGSAIYRYDPFGSMRPGSASLDRFGFTGEWRDASGFRGRKPRRIRSRDPIRSRARGGYRLPPSGRWVRYVPDPAIRAVRRPATCSTPRGAARVVADQDIERR